MLRSFSLTLEGNSTTRGIKVDILIEKLSDLHSSGHKVIIFSQFTSFLKILKKKFQKYFRYQNPRTNRSTRDRTIPAESFEKTNGSAVILASLKAAGLGVTLKSADYVFLMDPWWNPLLKNRQLIGHIVLKH